MGAEGYALGSPLVSTISNTPYWIAPRAGVLRNLTAFMAQNQAETIITPPPQGEVKITITITIYVATSFLNTFTPTTLSATHGPVRYLAGEIIFPLSNTTDMVPITAGSLVAFVVKETIGTTLPGGGEVEIANSGVTAISIEFA